MSKKDIAAISDALTGRGRYGHSPLYWWMWDHFDALQKDRLGRSDWRSATEKFTEIGFTGRDGSPLNRENVRKTWGRVVRDKEKHSAKRRPVEVPERPPERMTQAAPVPPRPSTEGPAMLPPDEDEKARWDRLGFKPMGDWTKKQPKDC